MSANVWVKCGKVYNLLDAATTVAAGTTKYKDAVLATFQAWGTTTAGAGAAVIRIEASNIDETNSFVPLGTISLTLGTTITTDGFATEAPWKFVRANVLSISGTNASVNVLMGV